MHFRKAAAPLSFLLIFLVNGCGGSGSSPVGGSGGKNISGTINATSFTIPAGATVTATADTTIITTGNIDIEGTLQVANNANLALLAKKSLIVHGKVMPSSTLSATIPTTPSSRPQASGGSGTNWVLGGDSNSQIDHINGTPGTNVEIVSSGTDSDFTLNVYNVTLPAGKPSTLSVDPGGNGGSVLVGTTNAIKDAAARGLSTATAPAILNIRGNIVAGDGGHGFDDNTGVSNQFGIVATGSKGGNGGAIVLLATKSIEAQGSGLNAGNGGRGGGCGVPGPLAGRSGSEQGQKGESVTANPGAGGDGGSVTASPTPSGGLASLGIRGQQGPVSIKAGDGGPNGGAGGDLAVNLSKTGIDGTSTLPHTVGTVGNVAVELLAGNGSDSGSPSVAGGNAGAITITNTPGQTNFAISIGNGNGGAGYQACTTLVSAGKKGGDGCKANLAGFDYTFTGNTKQVFNGGAGGAGNPAGAGGAAGVNEKGKEIGQPGALGKLCAGNGLKVSGTINDSSSEFMEIDSSKSFLFSSATPSASTVTKVPLGGGSNTTIPLSSPASDTNNVLAGGGATTRASTSGNLLYVSSTSSHAVLIVDETQGKQVGSIPLVGTTSGPNAIGFDAANGRLYATSDQGVNVYDTNSNNSLVATIATQAHLQAMAINPTTNRLYLISGFASPPQLIVIDTAQNKVVTSINLPGYSGVVALNPATNMVYVPIYNSSSLVVINGSTNAIATTIAVGPNPWGVVADSQRNHVYVANYNYSATNQQAGSVTEIDGSTNKVITTVTVGKGPTGIGMNESTDTVYVSNAVDKTVSVMTGG